MSTIRLGANPEVIRLGNAKKKKGWASISSQLKKIEKLPTPLRIIASPKTTVALGTTLGALTGGWGGAIKAGIGTSGAITGASLLSSSPTAKKFAEEKFTKPAELGAKLGEAFEKLTKAPEQIKKQSSSFLDKIKGAILPTAGIVGLGAGALALGKATKEKLKKIKSPLLSKSTTMPQIIPSSAMSGAPTAQIIEQPIGAVKEAKKKRSKPRRSKKKASPMVRITNKINIKNSNRAGKKYIKVLALNNSR